MTPVSRLTVTITFRWWFHVYLNTLVFACQVTGMEPNWDRVNYWTLKAMRLGFNR